MKDCKCTSCGRRYTYTRKAGHTHQRCNSCNVNLRRHNVKQKCVDHLGGKCSACGYNKCLQALDFHHVDDSTKEFNISGAHARSWAVIEEELNKCVLLCANCHREHHAQENKDILT